MVKFDHFAKINIGADKVPSRPEGSSLVNDFCSTLTT